MSYTFQFENFRANNSGIISSICNANYKIDSGFEESYSRFCNSIGEYNAFQVGSTNTFLTIVEEYIEAISNAKSTLNAYLEAAESSKGAIDACYSTDCGAYDMALDAYEDVMSRPEDYRVEVKSSDASSAYTVYSYIDTKKMGQAAIYEREKVWRGKNSDLWRD